MRSLARYAVANTAVRSKLATLLKREHYEALARADSREDAWNILLGTPWGEKLPAWTEQSSYEIEALLHNLSGTRFRGVVATLAGKPAEAGKELLSRWDLDRLEYALRLWHGKESDATAVSGYQTYVQTFSTEAVVSSDTLEDVVRVLEHTPYAAVIEGAASDYKQKHSLFYLENALEKDFYQRVIDSLSRLGGLDGDEARAMVDAEIDFLNISTVARLGDYSGIPAGQVHEYLAVGGSLISRDLRRSERAGSNVGELLARTVAGTPSVSREMSSHLEGVDALEKALDHIARLSARRALSGYPFSFKTILAFYVLTRADFRQLRSLFAATCADTECHVPVPVSPQRR